MVAGSDPISLAGRVSSSRAAIRCHKTASGAKGIKLREVQERTWRNCVRIDWDLDDPRAQKRFGISAPVGVFTAIIVCLGFLNWHDERQGHRSDEEGSEDEAFGLGQAWQPG